ncbi:DUF1281 family ferredoxin-like fold protein [Paralysiella testudinis]|uniref:YubB ferredoxin-like domain-containing protein n=1 Tax=Paralysiella testudinis TaxID=2809020 RepID=A0A892ZFZ8_9NEIS|nr:hypothetical protein [Paralysiella testudinis]QRQ81480.1 hypothetical protein JQU52_12340 [Paralysiella testudinis]
MPNWCLNHVLIEGDAELIADLAARMISDNPDQPFDFNGIHPMPEELLVAAGSGSMIMLEWNRLKPETLLSEAAGTLCQWHIDLLQQHLSPLTDWPSLTVAHASTLLADDIDLQRRCRTDLALGVQLQRNIERYGHPSWYDWRVENWGTKWNACESTFTVGPNSIKVSFDTAWAPPEGVYAAICAAYPDLQLTALYIEDGMSFAGSFYNANGHLDDEPCSDCCIADFGAEHFGFDLSDDEDDDED